ncbi:hypothetical protein AX27061_2587 [Achromobacter xylosoxidans NBRC 15126 = ATCC 27061]|nr:hypothetical protein AX27061_2587 [Achromobacter xylosoxidans NBRC 15126 = ATCC 27061]
MFMIGFLAFERIGVVAGSGVPSRMIAWPFSVSAGNAVKCN